MTSLRSLASQTVIYGLSSILGRFLNYLLVPLYTYSFPAAAYGVVSEFYAYAGFFAVVLVFGLETGFFRFRTREGVPAEAVYPTAQSFLLLANLLFLLAAIGFRQPLAEALRYPDHSEYVVWFALILGLDAISALPFARLRAEERAWRFAGIKLAEILAAIGLNLLFILAWPKAATLWPESALARAYDPGMGVGYIFLANVLASGLKLLLLLPSFRMETKPDFRLLKPLLGYSLPLVIIGFAGMVNEMLDRAMLKYWLPYDLETNLRQLGIYGACYKLSVLMSLFIQAFRYAGEPFFFAYANRADARNAYALVMKYFVIFCVFIFLLVTLFIDVFQYFVGAEYREGLDVVPVLLMANLFLGIYVNLSIWYKLTDQTLTGAGVSVFGAMLTLTLNLWWIPTLGYRGAAWATLACYAAMTAFSYGLGRRFYPVPYPLIRIVGYMALGLALFAANLKLAATSDWNPWAVRIGLLALYGAVAFMLDGQPLLQRRRRRPAA